MSRGPRRVRHMDAAGILAGLGALTLWLALTDGMYRYLRPSMRPWLVASGAFVLVVAVASGALAWREARRTASPAGLRVGLVGWLLLLPLVVALSTDPAALGAFAVRLQSGAAAPATGDFDLEAYLAAHSTAGQAPHLGLQQFTSAAFDDDDADLLAGTEVRLTGFVVEDPGREREPGRLTIARLMVGCCAGDAAALVVDVAGDDVAELADDTWVEVTGRFDPVATARQADGGGRVPVLQLRSLRQVDAPREPYEYPG